MIDVYKVIKDIETVTGKEIEAKHTIAQKIAEATAADEEALRLRIADFVANSDSIDAAAAGILRSEY